jgi:hypothetical protein
MNSENGEETHQEQQQDHVESAFSFLQQSTAADIGSEDALSSGFSFLNTDPAASEEGIGSSSFSFINTTSSASKEDEDLLLGDSFPSSNATVTVTPVPDIDLLSSETEPTTLAQGQGLVQGLSIAEDTAEIKLGKVASTKNVRNTTLHSVLL